MPTGKDSWRDVSTPRSDPAQTMCCSGISSQKYFRDVSARGQDWISSSTMSVLPGTILRPRAVPRLVTILLGSRSSPKSGWRSLLRSRSRYAMESNSFLPNSLSMYVLPHWRTPSRISGLRSGLSFQARSSE